MACYAPVQVQSKVYQDNSYSSIPQLKASRIYQCRLSANTAKFSSPSPISKRESFPVVSVAINKNQYYNGQGSSVKNLIACGSKGSDEPTSLLLNIAKKYSQIQGNELLAAGLVGSSVLLLSWYLWNQETIPYSNRNHFVILPKDLEKKIGEALLKELKENKFKDKILPATHPDTVRVNLIFEEIIKALQKRLGLGLRKDDATHELLAGEGKFSWPKNNEILDLKYWIQKGQEKRLQAGTSHLEGMNWEVLVVDKATVNAFCLPGGKIVIYTGLLKHLKTNEEIATVIGHEVGHVVARHEAERITQAVLLMILQLIVSDGRRVTSDSLESISSLLLKLPSSRKREMEADYIGMILAASAGYDPQVAPTVYERLDEISNRSESDSKLKDYFSTHPCGKTRAQSLIQSDAMKEALNIYNEVRTK